MELRIDLVSMTGNPPKLFLFLLLMLLKQNEPTWSNFEILILFDWQALCPRSTEDEIQAIILHMIDFYSLENVVSDWKFEHANSLDRPHMPNYPSSTKGKRNLVKNSVCAVKVWDHNVNNIVFHYRMYKHQFWNKYIYYLKPVCFIWLGLLWEGEDALATNLLPVRCVKGLMDERRWEE